MRTDEWHAAYVQINMQIVALVFRGCTGPLQNSGMAHSLRPSQTLAEGSWAHALQLGPGEKLSAGAQQAGRQAVGTAEQAVSCDYLLCSGAELSGSRWG